MILIIMKGGCQADLSHRYAQMAQCLFCCSAPFSFHVITGAQLRNYDFGFSLIFTYNCDETFKTTSRILSENMPGHT